MHGPRRPRGDANCDRRWSLAGGRSAGPGFRRDRPDRGGAGRRVDRTRGRCVARRPARAVFDCRESRRHAGPWLLEEDRRMRLTRFLVAIATLAIVVTACSTGGG